MRKLQSQTKLRKEHVNAESSYVDRAVGTASRKREKPPYEASEKERRLTSQISKIDAEITSLKGTPAAAPKKARRVRRRQAKSLRQHVVDVLKASSQPLTAQEITDAVVKAGYKSSSKNLVTLVRLTCYKSDEIQRKGRGKFSAKGGK